MGLLRRLLWPSRREKEEDDEAKARTWKKGKRADHAGVYRIEVDGESRHLRGEGPPFSFWGSSRIILILSFLLWWIQPAGPMIAGYVGGRRAGSSIKAIIAALLPVFLLFVVNAAYAHTVPAGHGDFVATLPQAIGDGAASIIPFLGPYKDFLIAYMAGFVQALQTTFGMGTNGYLMVVIFAYIGGLIAEQTRRELYYKSGASQSVGLNILQPILGGRRHPDEAEAYEFEDDAELREMRRPARARARGARAGRYRRGGPDRFDDFRKVHAETTEGHTTHRFGRARSRDEGDEYEEEEEVEAPVRHGLRERHEARRAHARGSDDEEDEEAVARREAQETQARKPRLRTREEEIALQRFVERALRNYDHAKG